MIKIPNYKEVDYKSFQIVLYKKFADAGKPVFNIAETLQVKSQATVQNAFNTEKQVVSDDIISGVMQCLGLDGFVVWNKRQRKYYISNKK